MAVAYSLRGGGLLIAAGIYQLSPSSRTPASASAARRRFYQSPLSARRPGRVCASGASRRFCVGCCWLLMALLFVGGVMNLAWIVALTLIGVGAKLLPGGQWIARLSGAVLVAWGTASLLA